MAFLSNAVLTAMEQCAFMKDEMTLNLPIGLAKSSPVFGELKRIIELIGGVVSSTQTATFEYPARAAWRFMLSCACLPDRKTYQFYPTPPVIAARVVSMANIETGHSVCEPSAGNGDLAALVTRGAADEPVVCVELSELRCSVLRSRGLNAFSADFLLGQRPRFSLIAS